MITPRAPLSADATPRHYDELDRFYRELWGEHLHHGLWTTGRETPEQAVVALARLVAERAGVRPGAHVCDVGCGYGATARLLAREYGACVTALTIAPAQHAYATSHDGEGDNPRYLLRDWLANALPSAAAPLSRMPTPQLQTAPQRELRALRDEKRAMLASYRWLDRSAGVVQIPIERAMEIMAGREEA